MAAIFIKTADKDKREFNYEKIGEGATKKEITEIIFSLLFSVRKLILVDVGLRI